MTCILALAIGILYILSIVSPVHTLTLTYTLTHSHPYPHTLTLTYTLTHSHPYPHTLTHTYTLTHSLTPSHTHSHPHTLTHTYTLTLTYILTHSHPHRSLSRVHSPSHDSVSTRGGREEPEGRYDDDEYVTINGAQPIKRGTVERAYIKYILFFGGRDSYNYTITG